MQEDIRSNINRFFKNITLIGMARVITILVGLLGFIFNYTTLKEVATDNFDIVGHKAIIFPLLLDGLMIVAHVVYYWLNSKGVENRMVRGTMYTTVFFSSVFALTHAHWDFILVNFWGSLGQNTMALLDATAWGALSPIALLICVEMISVMESTMAKEKLKEDKGGLDSYETTISKLELSLGEFQGEVNKLSTQNSEVSKSLEETNKVNISLQSRLQNLEPFEALVNGDTRTFVLGAKQMWPPLSQKALAQMTGLSESRISQIVGSSSQLVRQNGHNH